MESFSIVRIWAAAAWVDGMLHPKEEEAIRRFLDDAQDLDAAQRQVATQLLIAKPAVSLEEEIGKLSEAARENVYRSVIAMVQIDELVTDDELSFVTRLRDQLGLPSDVVRKIEQETR